MRSVAILPQSLETKKNLTPQLVLQRKKKNIPATKKGGHNLRPSNAAVMGY